MQPRLEVLIAANASRNASATMYSWVLSRNSAWLQQGGDVLGDLAADGVRGGGRLAANERHREALNLGGCRCGGTVERGPGALNSRPREHSAGGFRFLPHPLSIDARVERAMRGLTLPTRVPLPLANRTGTRGHQLANAWSSRK